MCIPLKTPQSVQMGHMHANVLTTVKISARHVENIYFLRGDVIKKKNTLKACIVYVHVPFGAGYRYVELSKFRSD